jgi:hypothetical protein
VGTFALEPANARLEAGDTLALGISWTLPEPRVWRDLRSLELRLRDADGVAWALRWDEPSDAFVTTDVRSPSPVSLAGPRTQAAGLPVGA